MGYLTRQPARTVKLPETMYKTAVLTLSLLFALQTGAPAQTTTLTGPGGFSIPMLDHRVTWQRQYTLPRGPLQAELFQRLRQALSPAPFTTTAADPETGTLFGTGTIKAITGGSDHYYLLRFNWVVTVNDAHYSFRATHFFEKPVGMGTTSEYSKIEYRSWDNHLGHPWSPEDHRLFTGLDSAISALMDRLYREVNIPRWHVLALYENGGHHIDYSRRARRMARPTVHRQ